MKFVDSVMAPGATPSWVSKKIIATHKEEIENERRKEEEEKK